MSRSVLLMNDGIVLPYDKVQDAGPYWRCTDEIGAMNIDKKEVLRVFNNECEIAEEPETWRKI